MKKRNILIDVLRGFAILLVLGRHMNIYPPTSFDPIYPLLKIWHTSGWMGVDLFFVLSGFLVSGLLFSEYKKHQEVKPLHFLIRRGFKIYPIFYFLVFLSIFRLLFAGKDIFTCNLLSEILFIQNYSEGLWEHTWSLAVEEHFYIVLALSVYLISRKRKQTSNPFSFIPYAFIFMALGSLIFRLSSMNETYSNFTHVYPSHIRFDGLFFGTMIAYFYHFDFDSLKRFAIKWRFLLIFFGMIGIIPNLFYKLNETNYIYSIGFTLNYLSFGSMLIAILFFEPPKENFATIVLAKIGFYSYSIYVFHIPFKYAVFKILFKYFKEDYSLLYIGLIIYLMVAIFGGILISKLIEIPMLKLRERLFPSRSNLQ